MNRQMWAAAATQENLERLSSRGVAVLGPGTGDQACGEVGPGRMVEPTELLEYLLTIFQKNSKLSGIKVLVTAGPTQEAIDPVRYISNLSSGKTGYALAQAAAEAGAYVTLVSGPVALERHPSVQFIDVRSAHEMYEAVMRIATQQDIVIGAAAVADYRSRSPAPQKIKKTDDVLTLILERTPDILAAVAALDPRPFTVGFAAETVDLEKNALAKLHTKSLDMVVANQVGVAGTGFNSEENALHVFWPTGDREFSRAPKEQLAHELIDLINERYREKNSTEDT
jgi:phosphopantothenoylcysteine decarboxylase/phosphopantothenate--cysteine ligase